MKQQMKNLFLSSLIGAGLVGCSGEITEEVNEISMETGVSYTVKAGDSVVDQGDAEIEVTHLLEADLKQVKLISGSASLIYGSYDLK